MRFTTVDPIRDGSNWYSYVGNDPINYVDLLGLEMQISGTSAFQAQTLADMQKLTRDTLSMRTDGTIIITNVSNSNGDRNSGTELIRDLNTKFSVTGDAKDKNIIEITESSLRNMNHPNNYINAGNGSGTGSNLQYYPASNPQIKTVDKNTGYAVKASRPTEIGLAHEMIHAQHARDGNVSGYIDASGNPQLTKGSHTYLDSTRAHQTTNYPEEEYRTVGVGYNQTGDITENDIRKEQGLCARASY